MEKMRLGNQKTHKHDNIEIDG